MRNVRKECQQRQKMQMRANNYTEEQLGKELDRQFKSLENALRVNSEKHIKYHSENVVILNRINQKKFK